MIVLSAFLVFLAAALLVDGVFFGGDSTVPWQIWVAVAVSAAAFGLLFAGAYRERRHPGAAPDGGPAVPPRFPLRGDPGASAPTWAPPAVPPSTGAPAVPPAVPSSVSPAVPSSAPPTVPPPSELPPSELLPSAPLAAEDRTVLVVAGRPRYHLAGCRYVVDAAAHPLNLAEARAAGYTACTVCRPDERMESTGAATGQPAADRVDADQPTADQLDAEEEAARSGAAVPGDEGPTVVLVRGFYHRPDCRYVAVAAESRPVPRGEARRGGALPCGVCRP